MLHQHVLPGLWAQSTQSPVRLAFLRGLSQSSQTKRSHYVASKIGHLLTCFLQPVSNARANTYSWDLAVGDLQTPPTRQRPSEQHLLAWQLVACWALREREILSGESHLTYTWGHPTCPTVLDKGLVKSYQCQGLLMKTEMVPPDPARLYLCPSGGKGAANSTRHSSLPRAAIDPGTAGRARGGISHSRIPRLILHRCSGHRIGGN